MESIRLNLHTAALIGNVQIRVLGYVLQKSDVPASRPEDNSFSSSLRQVVDERIS